jgi:Phosphoesterase family
LMKSSAWSTSALMWTYDGWGGWYDHVAPPQVDSRGYGFRVPALLVSPYAKKGVVDHTVLDYTAMLHFIETNWKLAPLSIRDKQSVGLASAFDFSAAPRPAASLPWTWPPPEVRAATDSPAPVIYSIYGAAAALAIAIVSMAARARGPITVPGLVTRATVLVRSSFESVRDRMVRLLWGTQYSPSPAVALEAAALTGDIRERPARLSHLVRGSLTLPGWLRRGALTDRKGSWVTWHRAKEKVPTNSPNEHDPTVIRISPRDQKRADETEIIADPTASETYAAPVHDRQSRNRRPKLSHSQRHKLGHSQGHKLSRHQRPKLNRHQPLILSENQAYKLSRSQRPKLNRHQPLILSQNQPHKLSRSQRPKLSQGQRPKLSRQQRRTLGRR